MSVWISDKEKSINASKVDAIEQGTHGTWVYLGGGVKLLIYKDYEEVRQAVEAASC